MTENDDTFDRRDLTAEEREFLLDSWFSIDPEEQAQVDRMLRGAGLL